MDKRKKKQQLVPFMPTSSFPNILGRKDFDNKSTKTLLQTSDEIQIKDVLNFKMNDAETNEPLTLSFAKWSCTEGRINLIDRDTILKLGTGKLLASPELESRLLLRHSLVTEFMHEGPRSKIHHRYWNPRSDELDFPIGYNNDELPRLENSSFAAEDKSFLPELKNSNRRDFPDMINEAVDVQPLENIETQDSSNKKKVLLSQSLDPENEDVWGELELKYYNEIFGLVKQLELNKKLTREPLLRPNWKDIVNVCKDLAKKKANGYREIVRAIEDENLKEIDRKALETARVNDKELTKEKVRDKVKLLKKHEEDRDKFRIYLQYLQNDNEIIFLRRLFDEGILW